MSLIGTLAEVKIADVLRLFSGGHKTGILTVTAPAQHAVLRFQKGAIVHAASGPLAGHDAVLDLFGWKEGQLSFVPEDKLPPVVPNVTRDVALLIDEGLRVGALRHRIRTLIPSERVVFQLAVGPADDSVRVAIGVREWKVIRLLDGTRDVKAVVDACALDPSDVHRILCELTEAGFLQRVEVQKVLRAHSVAGVFAKETAEADERLKDEWTRIARFEAGVARLQVRTLTGRSAVVTTTFRAGLGRDIHLPRTVMAELGLREGEDVHVRPVA